jgi:hypothetical protein
MKINKTPSPDRLSIKKWLITDSTDRLYLFIDESGDAGIYTGENSGASKYFMINVLVASSKGVNILEKHFSRYRYFKNADKELKRYRQHKNDQDILDDLLVNISSTQNVMSFSFCIDKEKYIGPYLNSIGRNEKDYDATKFRNFVTKISLEKIFEKIPVVKSIDGKFRSIEIIFDRYLENKNDEENLKKYLNENYKLPIIQFINQLDSNYCAQLQMADVLGSLVKRKVFDGENIDTKDIKIFVTDNPDSVIELKEKGPDTQRGTGTLPSMGT